MIKKKIRNNNPFNKYKELIIVYLSDSKASETNIPYRLTKIISTQFLDYKIIFKELNINNIFLIFCIIIKSVILNKIILVNSHNLSSILCTTF